MDEDTQGMKEEDEDDDDNDEQDEEHRTPTSNNGEITNFSEIFEEEDAIARVTNKSTKAPRINPWFFLPLTLKYQLKSSSKLSQSFIPCASTISSIDFLKSENGSSESIDNTVVPSFNGADTPPFSSSFRIELDFPAGSKSSLSDRRPRIILSIGSPPEKSDAVERLPEDSDESVKTESEESVAAAAAAAAAFVRKERVLGCRHDGQGQVDLSSGEDLKRDGSFIIIIVFFFLLINMSLKLIL